MPPHDAQPYSHPFRRATLAARKPTRFDLRPDEDQRAAIAADLGLIALRSVALTGELRPTGRQDYVLEAQLRAEAVQACVVTNDPVTTRIDEPVLRRYLAGWQARHDYSPNTATAIDEEIRALIDHAFARSLQLLEARRALLERAARQLLATETLDATALQQLVTEAV